MENSEIRLLYLTMAGSHLYGLNTPESDLDLKGIAVAQRHYYTGFAHRFEQVERKAEKGFPCDLDIYNITKYFTLLTQGNPNVIELLFADESSILYQTIWGAQLRTNRDLFISKRLRHSFSGYAIAQLKRIKTHRNWLIHPPTKQPERSDFGLPEKPLITKDHIGAFQWVLASLLEDQFQHLTVEEWLREKLSEISYIGLIQSRGVLPQCAQEIKEITGASDNFIEVMLREQAYLTAQRGWKQYLNWKETRNPKRAELERRFGYDTKHACHLVRLMRMCAEILEGQGVIVKRPDAEELLAIKQQGLWAYDELIEWAEKEDARMEALYQVSTIPKNPPLERLNVLCQNIVEEAFDWEEDQWVDWEDVLQQRVAQLGGTHA